MQVVIKSATELLWFLLWGPRMSVPNFSSSTQSFPVDQRTNRQTDRKADIRLCSSASAFNPTLLQRRNKGGHITKCLIIIFIAYSNFMAGTIFAEASIININTGSKDDWASGHYIHNILCRCKKERIRFWPWEKSSIITTLHSGKHTNICCGLWFWNSMKHTRISTQWMWCGYLTCKYSAPLGLIRIILKMPNCGNVHHLFRFGRISGQKWGTLTKSPLKHWSTVERRIIPCNFVIN